MTHQAIALLLEAWVLRFGANLYKLNSAPWDLQEQGPSYECFSHTAKIIAAGLPHIWTMLLQQRAQRGLLCGNTAKEDVKAPANRPLDRPTWRLLSVNLTHLSTWQEAWAADSCPHETQRPCRKSPGMRFTLMLAETMAMPLTVLGFLFLLTGILSSVTWDNNNDSQDFWKDRMVNDAETRMWK